MNLEFSQVKKFFSYLLVAVLLGSTSGCMFFNDDLRPTQAGFDGLAKYNPDGDPQLRPGVNVRIIVAAGGVEVIPEVVKEISAVGDISLPFIGVVKCEGMTLVQLQNKLAEDYKKYFIDPSVTAHFVYQSGLTSPWGTVLIMGQVSRPGPVDIPPTCDLNVIKALQLAGGITTVAKKESVYVTRRKADGTVYRRVVNIDEIGRTGKNDLDIVLKAGDVIWVPESVW